MGGRRNARRPDFALPYTWIMRNAVDRTRPGCTHGADNVGMIRLIATGAWDISHPEHVTRVRPSTESNDAVSTRQTRRPLRPHTSHAKGSPAQPPAPCRGASACDHRNGSAAGDDECAQRG